jgi:hypothetical protein
MKKLKLVAVALLFGMTSMFASEKVEKTTTEIRNQIVTLFDDAKFIAESDFKVNFSFTFNANGEIIVLNVDSTRADIKDYLRKNVNYKKLDNPGIPNEVYTMPIKVKVIS